MLATDMWWVMSDLTAADLYHVTAAHLLTAGLNEQLAGSVTGNLFLDQLPLYKSAEVPFFFIAIEKAYN